ncbi:MULTISPECIES: hypothetical protein [unclassified Bacillus (in: firmicutes)]|uniref:hypothetical protein n=2 Tax=Bacillus TaxID=1386 RepID=UPI0013EE448F|nr:MULTISPECIES: hypothetical protein [unclassified Bacillus (in: firmicutes)]KAF6547832.1 hypothetical protein G9F51_08605 [Bacillus sp. EKM207B]KAF6548905.1 hypothetical protein G9F50_07280 [Bacillus sp. EKM206B]
MKAYKFEGKVTADVMFQTVASSAVEAYEQFNKHLVLWSEGKRHGFVISQDVAGEPKATSRLLPAHLTADHLELIQFGYDIDEVLRYSAEDAEAEIDAIRSGAAE